MTLQDLLGMGFQQTPEGKLFLPFSLTDPYNTTSRVNYDESGNPFYVGTGYDNGNPTPQAFGSLEDAFKSYKPEYVGASFGNDQNAFSIPSSAVAGTYNGELGYTLDPSQLGYGPIQRGGSSWNAFRDEWLKPVATSIAGGALFGTGGTPTALDYGAGIGAEGGGTISGTGTAVGGAATDVAGTQYASNAQITDSPVYDTTGSTQYYNSGMETGAGENFGLTGNEWPAAAGDGGSGIWDIIKSGAGGIYDFLNSKVGGTILGGLLGSVNKSKQAGTTTKTESNIADWQRPYVEAALQDASRIYDTIPGGVDPLTAAGRDYFGNVITGNYLTNPYEQAAANAVSADAANGCREILTRRALWFSCDG